MDKFEQEPVRFHFREPAGPFDVKPFFGVENGSFIAAEEKEEPTEVVRSACEEWTCVCGTKTTKLFCPNCGLPENWVFK